MLPVGCVELFCKEEEFEEVVDGAFCLRVAEEERKEDEVVGANLQRVVLCEIWVLTEEPLRKQVEATLLYILKDTINLAAQMSI